MTNAPTAPNTSLRNRAGGRWPVGGVSFLCWAPIPLLAAAMVVLWAADPRTAYESPALVMASNFVFSVLVSSFIAYLIGRSFWTRGSPGLLLLGGGVVLWGAAGEVGTAVAHGDANISVTVHNSCVWLSALCHLAGVVLSLRSPRTLRARGLWLGAAFVLAAGAVGLVTLLALAGWLPAFFSQGHGGTLVRQVVLGSAVAMFMLTAVLLRVGNRPSLSRFAYWYILALLLIATGLLGVMIQSSLGSLLNWTARAAQFLSGVYMLMAALASAREPGTREITLGQALSEARYRYGVAIAIVLAAAAVRLAFLQVLGTHAAFITFYPAVMLAALYGGLRAGLLATVFSALVANYFWIEPVGRLSTRSPADWLSVAVFLIGCTMISWITEAMHRAWTRAAQAEAEARFAAERVRADEALRQSEERRKVAQAVQAERQRFNTVLEMLPAYVVLLSPDYHVPFANRFFRERFGESHGKRCFEYLFGRTQPCEICETCCVLETHAPHRWEWSGPDGRDYDVYDFPFTDADGAPLIMEMGIDITERKQAEAALKELNETLERRVAERTASLRESEQRERQRAAELQAVLDTAPVAIWIAHDPQCRQITGNAAADRLLQAPRSANISASAPSGEAAVSYKVFRDGVALKPEQMPAQIATATGGPVLGDELELVFADGRRVHLIESAVPLFDADGRVCGAIIAGEDITERKRAERQLKELNETLEKRVAERTAVAEMRSEQLRMLAQELTQAEQRERQRIAHILHEHFQQLLVGAKFNLSMVQARDADSQESLRRTDQVLTEAVEASRSLAVELSPPILHYGGLAPALGWLGHWMHGKHGLKVEVVAEPHVPLPAEDVQVLLFQAARELLFNVVKHARVDRAKVELQQEPGRLLRLSVSDKGAGFRTDGLVAKACTPGGFGLFSIRERLSFLEGHVEIQSAPGTGTCISLLVPLPPTMQASALAGAAADRPATTSAEKADGAAGLPMASAARIRVLIADDHAIVRDGLSRLLQMQPDMAVVGVAKDGREAVELALRLRPDVVIMDVSMPERSGIEATRCILADLPATRIIGLSMHTDQDVADQMRQAGVAAYLAKTGPTDGLVAAIHASVRRT